MRKILTLIILFSSQCFAMGEMDSGGGMGIVCFDSKEIAENVVKNDRVIIDDYIDSITSINFLDYFYATQIRGPIGRTPELVPDNDNERDGYALFDIIMTSIEHKVPDLYLAIRDSEMHFISNEVVLTNMGIKPHDDAELPSVVTNSKCTLTTIASQIVEENESFLHVDVRLAMHPLNNDHSQAAMWLHEYLYLIARNNGYTNSFGTRKLVGLLLKKKTEKVWQDIERIAENFKFI